MEDDDEDDDDDGDDRLASCRYICILYVLAVTDEALNEAVRGEQNETLLYRIARQQTKPGGGREREEEEADEAWPLETHLLIVLLLLLLLPVRNAQVKSSTIEIVVERKR